MAKANEPVSVPTDTLQLAQARSVVRLALLDCHTMFHEIFLILYDINDLYDLIGF
jgi:hypothetical protein